MIISYCGDGEVSIRIQAGTGGLEDVRFADLVRAVDLMKNVIPPEDWIECVPDNTMDIVHGEPFAGHPSHDEWAKKRREELRRERLDNT